MQNKSTGNRNSERILAVAIIDPVGMKAGIDHYDLLLLSGIKENGIRVSLYSNFDYKDSEITYRRFFFNTNVSKIAAIRSNISGFIKSLRVAKKDDTQWLILHVFRAGLFDLVTFSLARLMGFKIAAIVHDIESLDTLSLPFVRKIVVGVLPNVRIVHNEFCREELVKTIGASANKNTGIIPHVNFTDLFSDYHNDVKKVADLKLKSEIISGLHPQLLTAVKSNTPIILFFGQIKKAKGVDVLLEAITQVNRECVVVIAGKTRNENWSKYEHIISMLNIKKKVIPVIRHITDEERDLLFAISDCIVLPYRLIYQSGVLLMAMSFPMTVVASDLAPNAAIVTSGSNGLKFKTDNSADLANKIQQVLDHPEEALAFREQALQDMKKLYSAKEIGMQYEMLLSTYQG